MLKIGSIMIQDPVILAPMAGVTDLPFRQLCMKLGAGMAVSEMLTSNIELWKTKKSQLRMNFLGEQSPRSVQIAGSDPKQMVVAAKIIADQGAQIVDINMGCPTKKVCKKAAGSALMKDPELVKKIVSAVVKAVAIPVTLKMRTGWDVNNKNVVQLSKMAEENGIAMLTIHGRTRACKYQGFAEYHTIAEVCKSVNIPVVANGDIDSVVKAKYVLELTQADGVMIGRAAQGRPWLLGQIAHFFRYNKFLEEPSLLQQHAILIEHLEKLYQFYGETQGIRIARKHVAWYLGNDNQMTRKEFNQINSIDSQKQFLDRYFLCN